MFSVYRLLNGEIQPWIVPYVENTSLLLCKRMIDDLGILLLSTAPKGEIGVGTERKLVTSYKVDAILRAFVSEKRAIRLLVSVG
jgi:hypothetical protein